MWNEGRRKAIATSTSLGVYQTIQVYNVAGCFPSSATRDGHRLAFNFILNEAEVLLARQMDLYVSWNSP